MGRTPGSGMRRRLKQVGIRPWWAVYILRGSCLLLGIGIGLAAAEIVLRLACPASGLGSARELSQFRRLSNSANLFTVDPEFGFRPVLDNRLYNAFGTLTNGYAVVRRTGVQRVLFLGDSVTARGHIVDALRRCYGDEGYEYWNGGVESFNTVQEAAYYRRYCHRVAPDHVVLTFHLNDFETTPVAFRRFDGSLVVYAPNFPAEELNGWLFRFSYLYRLGIGLAKCGNEPIDAVVAETEAALVELQDELRRTNVRFTVVVFPFLKPWRNWTPGERYSHRQILEILSRRGIRHIDLLPAVQEARDAGIELCETTGDVWHPGSALAARLGEYLHACGLLSVETFAQHERTPMP